MIDIKDNLKTWRKEEGKFCIATIIRTWRSAPRKEGAAMLVREDGLMTGSVSGGCVEGDVIREAQQVLQGGEAKKLSYGVVDEDAWSVGLSCGGQIDLWLEPVDPSEAIWDEWLEKIESDQGCILVTRLEHPGEKFLFNPDRPSTLPADLQEACNAAYRQHKTQIAGDYFLNVFPSRSRMIIIGAAHISLDLIGLAHKFNFETIVIDPRGIFTQNERMDPKPDQVYQAWPADILPKLKPDANTYVVVLTHDPKIDDQALQMVLSKQVEVAYVGALGSRKTHAKRTARLREAGLDEEQIQKISAPVGLPINARDPSEIALSIMAQVIFVKNRYL